MLINEGGGGGRLISRGLITGLKNAFQNKLQSNGGVGGLGLKLDAFFCCLLVNRLITAGSYKWKFMIFYLHSSQSITN